MEQNEVLAGNENQAAEPATGYDPAKVEAFMQELKDAQNLPLGIIGGVVAALVGALIWAGITVATKFQIGWMAIGVGFLVGFAVSGLGRGISTFYGYIGGACALLGCLLGNLLSTCGFIAIEESMPMLEVVGQVASQPSVAVELLTATFSPMDLVFYGIAVYEGYKFSFRKITPLETAALQNDGTSLS